MNAAENILEADQLDAEFGGDTFVGEGVVREEAHVEGFCQPEQFRATTQAHFSSTHKWWVRAVVELSTCATRATAPYGILALAVLGLVPAVLIVSAIGAQIYWISLVIEWQELIRESPRVAEHTHTSSTTGSGEQHASTAVTN